MKKHALFIYWFVDRVLHIIPEGFSRGRTKVERTKTPRKDNSRNSVKPCVVAPTPVVAPPSLVARDGFS